MKKTAALLLAFACLVFSLSALAQGGLSEGEKKNIARTLFAEGVKLQEGGRYQDALAKFEGAQKNFSAPTNMLHIAECQALVGRLVDAEESYNTLARMRIDPDKDPPIFAQAQQQGAAEASSVTARIPKIKVEVTPAPSTLQNLQITFNDKPMPPELIGVPHQMDPGTYRVAAYANGYLLREPSGDVIIKEKDVKTLMIVLAPVGGGAPPPVVVAQNNGSGTPPPVVGTNNGTQTGPVVGTDKPPPPYNGQPQPVQDNRNSFLLGVHLGLLLPFGNIPNSGPNSLAVGDKGATDVISTGYAVGIDGGLRVGKVFYVGAVGEIGTFAPGALTSAIPGASVSTSTGMLGVELGIISSPDHLAFWGSAGLGYRYLNQSVDSGALPVGGRDAHFTGFDLWGKLGVAIPIGQKFRLVPNAQLALGTLKRSDSDNLALGSTSGSVSGEQIGNSAIHGFLGVGMTGFYTDKL